MLDSYFDALGQVIGVHGSQVALLTCFVSSYPLGALFVYIPKDKPWLKHSFNIGVSLFFLIPMLHLWNGTLHLVGSALVTYILAATMRGRVMPWAVFGLVMGHLLYSHWERCRHPSEIVEISGTQMVLVMKLSTFAWNVYDGRQKLESLDESQKETRIETMPSLLSYFGYVLYFPAFLVGPALTYSDYMAFINEATYEKFRNAGPAHDIQPGRIPSGRKRAAFHKLVFGVAGIGCFALYGSKFGYHRLLEESLTSKPFWYRFLFVQAVGTIQRTKYYGGWKLTEGGCIISGYGFNGYDSAGLAIWDRASNVDIPNIEIAPNFKILLDSWNINTNVWLRNSVYKRLVPPGKRPNALTTLYTFMTSALWHGIYPGYYLTFFLGSLFSSASKSARKLLRPLLLPAEMNSSTSSKFASPSPIKRVYDIAGTTFTLAMTNYIAAPFLLLSLNKSVKVWGSLYWYGHVSVIAWLVLGNLGGFAWLSKVQKKRMMKAASRGATVVVKQEVVATPLGELIAPPLDKVGVDLHPAGNGTLRPISSGIANGNGRPMASTDRQS